MSRLADRSPHLPHGSPSTCQLFLVRVAWGVLGSSIPRGHHSNFSSRFGTRPSSWPAPSRWESSVFIAPRLHPVNRIFPFSGTAHKPKEDNHLAPIIDSLHGLLSLNLRLRWNLHLSAPPPSPQICHLDQSDVAERPASPQRHPSWAFAFAFLVVMPSGHLLLHL
jgi:hypothetical protein